MHFLETKFPIIGNESLGYISKPWEETHPSLLNADRAVGATQTPARVLPALCICANTLSLGVTVHHLRIRSQMYRFRFDQMRALLEATGSKSETVCWDYGTKTCFNCSISILWTNGERRVAANFVSNLV